MGAIGVFDSGVGGLSVLREIRRELPHEALRYVADSAYAPYGDKPADFVVRRSLALADFLIGTGATSLVVACNTATAAAVDTLRERFAVPIVGIEPAVKPAVEHTLAGTVGVLTTSRTALSARFHRLLDRFRGTRRIIVQPCPGWVELVERGVLDGPEAVAAVQQYVAPVIGEGADVLVLGCTHYSFLSPIIRQVVGDAVLLVDPAPAVARHLRYRLHQAGLLSSPSEHGREQFWTSADPAMLAPLMSELWGARVPLEPLPPAFHDTPVRL